MAEKKETKKAEKPSGKQESTSKTVAQKDPKKTTEKAEKEEKKEAEKEESYLKDIMAIGGHGGLFRFISQGRNGIIVESLENGKRMQAFATMKVSSLEDIAIYTEDEEVQLDKLFRSIHKYENGAEAISHKSDPDDLKDYFSAILPKYDRDRVYISDIRKVLNWYNFLLEKKMLVLDKPKKKPESKAADDSIKVSAEKKVTKASKEAVTSMKQPEMNKARAQTKPASKPTSRLPKKP